MQYVSLAETLGLNLGAAWTLFWTLFFVRLALGFAVGIDEVLLSLRKSPRDAASAEARSLRRGNTIVTVLNAALVLLFVLLTPLIAR